MATITANGLTSVLLLCKHRGTRQLDVHSLCHYAIFIELLAASVHLNINIIGIQSQSIHHKISLYADDFLLYLWDPTASQPATINLQTSSPPYQTTLLTS